MRALYLTLAAQMARVVFEKRGNHSEAHLSEVELTAMFAVAIMKGAELGKVRR